MDQVYSLVRLPEILHNYQHSSQDGSSLYPPPPPPPPQTKLHDLLTENKKTLSGNKKQMSEIFVTFQFSNIKYLSAISD